RGMRVVQDAANAASALESAQREAEKSFGRSESYMERYLSWPRHVEMQVFCDTHGNAVWLGERDCSCQRRHQKLIEESPAPEFPDEIRTAMGEAAVKVARACGYINAGYDEGDEVSQFYDNLMAKLIVWGSDREHARRRLIRALQETEIEGVATTIPAHLAILEHPDFIAARHSTKWVEDTLDLSGVAA